MKAQVLIKVLVLFLFLPVLVFAQYIGDRAVEQNFENSPLYFNSYYLNTLSMPGFKDVAAGFIRDPFLNLYNNPADFPEFKDRDYHIYMDFRSDRKVPVLISNYYPMAYYDAALSYIRPYDPRWLSYARTEPEPVVSAGILSYPLKELTEDFFLGGTYQHINRQEKYYQMPYGIYSPLYGYDAFNVRAEVSSSAVPTIDRQAGTDEMITEGHLYSVFTGIRFFNALKIGISFNGVNHKRDGAYMYLNNDEYGTNKTSTYSNLSSQAKNSNYDHTDFSAGLSYGPGENFSLGVKAGILKGKAEQYYNSQYLNFYLYKYQPQTTDSSRNYSNSSTMQNWVHDGTTRYISANFLRKIGTEKEVAGFYRYSSADIDVTNSSAISDTSNYSGRWSNYGTTQVYESRYVSTMTDLRTGSGINKRFRHEAMINFQWRLTGSASVLTGIYYSNLKTDIQTNEPAMARRFSESMYNSPQYNQHYLTRVFEDKIIRWSYTAKETSFQIPIFLTFDIGEKFALTFGINRILRTWEISDETLAYFNLRDKDENGVIDVNRNFAERYKQPVKKLSESTTDVLTKLNIKISPAFRVNLMLDPDFEHQFSIAQWWAGFEAGL